MADREFTDQHITREVISVLAMSPDVIAENINVHTTDGVVRLVGVVETAQEQNIAGELASEIDGVRAVENDLTTSPNGNITNNEIEQSVNQALADAGLTGIYSKVEADNVFLLGVARSVFIVENAVDVAKSIRGVRDVIVGIHITAGQPVDSIKLVDSVTEALSKDDRVDIFDLDVRADEGSVVLSGQVDDEREIVIAASIVESVPGVKQLENRLTTF